MKTEDQIIEKINLAKKDLEENKLGKYDDAIIEAWIRALEWVIERDELFDQ